MGENPTISVHSAKAVTAGDPAKQDATASVESSTPPAIEDREQSMMSVSTEVHDESHPEEETRDEPAEAAAAEEEVAAEPAELVAKK